MECSSINCSNGNATSYKYMLKRQNRVLMRFMESYGQTYLLMTSVKKKLEGHDLTTLRKGNLSWL